MNIVIYVFAISAFALGLAEFLPIGLTDVVAGNLSVQPAEVGASSVPMP